MSGWIIFACVVLALFLFSLIRLGVLAQYSAEGLLVRAKVWVFHITLYPIKAKKQKKERPKKERPKKEKKQEEPPEETAKAGGNLALVKRFLPLVAEAAGRFKRKVRIDKLYLDYMAASPDPAAAALEFGRANAAIGMILPLFEHNFRVKDRRVRTAVDFHGKKPTIFIHAELSLNIGQMGILGLLLLFKFFKITIQARTARKAEKEAV